jgi:hypothetical protein
MNNFIVETAKSAWKDPVLSKVISAAIIGMILWGWKQFGSASFSKAELLVAAPIALPMWLFLLLVIVAVVGLWKIRPRGKVKAPVAPAKALVHDVTDASSLVASWWPKSTGYFPDDVHIDYEELETKFSLAPGVAKTAASIVASQKCFKIKIPGERFATFEYDLNRASRG